MLESFEVSQNAESLYLYLLRNPAFDLVAIADNMGWTPEVLHGALDELSVLALLRPSSDNPLVMRPVAPDVGLESLLVRQQAELLSRQQRISESRAALAMVVAEYAGATPLAQANVVEEVVGLDAIRDRLARLANDTRHEVLTFAPGGAQDHETMEASKPLDMRLLDRGVTMRTIYLDSVRSATASASVAYATWLTELGGEVRTAPTLPFRMIVVDREVALIPTNPDESSVGAAVLTGRGAVAALCTLFDQVWRTSTPLGYTASRDANGLTSHERELLRMMANGDTDGHIARRMAFSTRTIGRTIADLMVRLGVRSRFQAGVRAAELGWLKPIPSDGLTASTSAPVESMVGETAEPTR